MLSMQFLVFKRTIKQRQQQFANIQTAFFQRTITKLYGILCVETGVRANFLVHKKKCSKEFKIGEYLADGSFTFLSSNYMWNFQAIHRLFFISTILLLVIY